MKHLVLTVDYELFFGSDSGTVENCMVRPVRALAKVLGKYGYKMTVFWDILHFYRLKQLENEIKELKIDRELIEKQIKWLIKQGHDVQMHIHPHWLDAQWINNKWKFYYTRFSVHRLWDKDDPEDIETITGCITQCRILMENICRQEDPDYSVRAFRAGGYRVEPFSRLAEALKQNGIFVDSSAALGMKSYNPQYPFDFSEMPPYLHYCFNDSVLKHDQSGEFWEFPKETIKVPGYIRVMFYILGNFVYVGKGIYGDGKRLPFMRKEQFGHWWTQIGVRYYRLTPEEMDPIRWKYLFSKSRRNGMVVLHSKNLSPFTVAMLDDSLAKMQVFFHSLKERMDALRVYDELSENAVG